MLSCGPVDQDNEAYQKLSTADKAKYRKYVLLGKEIYTDKCASCHQLDGRGLRGVIPPIAGADYLKNYQFELPCLLRYATKDTIMVNANFGDHISRMAITNQAIANFNFGHSNSLGTGNWQQEIG